MPAVKKLLNKHRKTVSTCIVVVLLAFGWWYFFREPEVDRGKKKSTLGKVVEPNAGSHGTGKVNQIDRSPPQKPSRAELDAMISRSSDKAGATVAAFLLTLDDHYLSQLESFPESELACMYLGMFATGFPNRVKWAQQLQKLQPANALGWLIEGKARVFLKDFDQASAAIQAGITKGKLRMPENEALVCVRSSLREMGRSQDEVRSHSLALGVGSNMCIELMGVSTRFWKAQVEKDPSEGGKIKAATMQLQLVDLMKSATDPSLSLSLAMLTSEENVLKQLPPDVEYGEGGATLASRLAQIKADRQGLGTQLIDSAKALSSASKEVQDGYYDRLESLGESAARRWLLSVSKQ